jgi:hypothetical protein
MATVLRGEDPLPPAEKTDLTQLRRFIQFFMMEHNGRPPRDANELTDWGRRRAEGRPNCYGPEAKTMKLETRALG